MNSTQNNVLVTLKRRSIEGGTICTAIEDETVETIGNRIMASWSTTSPNGNLRKFWLVTIGERGGLKWRARGEL